MRRSIIRYVLCALLYAMCIWIALEQKEEGKEKAAVTQEDLADRVIDLKEGN